MRQGKILLTTFISISLLNCSVAKFQIKNITKPVTIGSIRYNKICYGKNKKRDRFEYSLYNKTSAFFLIPTFWKNDPVNIEIEMLQTDPYDNRYMHANTLYFNTSSFNIFPFYFIEDTTIGIEGYSCEK